MHAHLLRLLQVTGLDGGDLQLRLQDLSSQESPPAHRGVLAPGPDVIECDVEICTGCERCVERCPFGSNRLVDGKIAFDPEKCYGCGLCVSTCPARARRLVERRGYSNLYYPIDFVRRFGGGGGGKGELPFGQDKYQAGSD